MSRRVVVASVVAVALILGASAAWAGHGRSAPVHHSPCKPGDWQYGHCQTEFLKASCTTSHEGGGWYIPRLAVPDSPDTGYRPLPDVPYLLGSGTAIFRADGTFVAGCRGTGFFKGFAPAFVRGLPCRIYRGGEDITLKGTKLYTGVGFVRVGSPFLGAGGYQMVHFVLGCAGSFDSVVRAN